MSHPKTKANETVPNRIEEYPALVKQLLEVLNIDMPKHITHLEINVSQDIFDVYITRYQTDKDGKIMFSTDSQSPDQVTDYIRI